MDSLSRYKSLSSYEQAIVALAVLLDGHDAETYLESDPLRHPALSKAANDLSILAPEIRLPLLGTLLREAIDQLENQNG
jgi:hypothetical protein